jgi:hypothetical protein
MTVAATRSANAGKVLFNRSTLESMQNRRLDARKRNYNKAIGFPWAYFVTAIEVGVESTVPIVALLERAPVSASIVNRVMFFDPWLHTNKNLPVGSRMLNAGCVPAEKGESSSSVRAPVLLSMEYAETLLESKFEAYRNFPEESKVTEIGVVAAAKENPGVVKTPVVEFMGRTEMVLASELATNTKCSLGSMVRASGPLPTANGEFGTGVRVPPDATAYPKTCARFELAT